MYSDKQLFQKIQIKNINQRMQYKKQNCRQNHKRRIQDFWDNIMRQYNNQANQLSPRTQINYEQKQLQKTKTMKKHKYFESGLESLTIQEKKEQKKSQGSTISDVLNELANYVEEKNTQIPWTKRYDWQQILVSSSKKSIQEEEKKERKLRKSKEEQKNFDSPIRMNRRKMNLFQEESFRTQSIKSCSRSTILLMQEKHQKESSRKSFQLDDEQMLDFLFRNNKITQTQTQNMETRSQVFPQKKYQLKPEANNHPKRKNYIDDEDDFEELIMMIENKKKERLRNGENNKEQQLQQQQYDSPIRNNRIKRNMLNIESPQSIQHNKSKPLFPCDSNKSNNHNNSNGEKSSYKVNRLKKQRQSQQTCTICICQIQNRAKLPCRHPFCRQCLVDWLVKSSSCPVCRKEAEYYMFNGEKVDIEQRKFSLENYVDNIEDDEDQEEEFLDFQCQNCEETLPGDEILVCDRCMVNATHVICDRALRGFMPLEESPWYCNVCRKAPRLWYIEKDYEDY